MKILIVLAHPEHQSFNGAMFRTAVETLSAAGHEVRTSDLHAMPVRSGVGQAQFPRRQGSGLFQAADRGNARHRDLRLRRGHRGGNPEDRVVRPDDLAVSAVVVRSARHSQGLGRPRVRDGTDLWRRPDLRQRRVQGQTRDAVADDGRPGAGLCQGRLQRRHPRHPAADPARHAAVRRLRGAGAADRLRAGAIAAGGSEPGCWPPMPRA